MRHVRAAIHSEKNAAELFGIMLDHGFNPNANTTDDAQATRWFHFLAKEGHVKLVGLCLKKGANINLRGLHGISPWFAAQGRG